MITIITGTNKSVLPLFESSFWWSSKNSHNLSISLLDWILVAESSFRDDDGNGGRGGDHLFVRESFHRNFMSPFASPCYTEREKCRGGRGPCPPCRQDLHSVLPPYRTTLNNISALLSLSLVFLLCKAAVIQNTAQVVGKGAVLFGLVVDYCIACMYFLVELNYQSQWNLVESHERPTSRSLLTCTTTWFRFWCCSPTRKVLVGTVMREMVDFSLHVCITLLCLLFGSLLRSLSRFGRKSRIVSEQNFHYSLHHEWLRLVPGPDHILHKNVIITGWRIRRRTWTDQVSDTGMTE